MTFLNNVSVKTFNLEDLVDRALLIKSFKNKGCELIIAFDNKTGETFILKEINHPQEARAK